MDSESVVLVDRDEDQPGPGVASFRPKTTGGSGGRPVTSRGGVRPVTSMISRPGPLSSLVV